MKIIRDSSSALLILLVIIWHGAAFAQVTFTDVTSLSKITAPPFGPSYNTMWADIDNDDYLDLFIARGDLNNHLSNQLFKNLRNGTFQDLSKTAFPGNQPAYNGHICWGDYDNDGFIDLYENHFDGTDNRLWHNDGHLVFSDRSSITFNTGTESTGDLWTDFDTDGFVDMIVNTQAGLGTLESRNNSGLNFKQVSLFTDAGQGHLLLSEDLNLDGVPDYYIGNIHTPDQCFLSSPQGYVPMDISNINGLRNIDEFMSASFADINNDGYADLLYIQNDHLFLFLNQKGNGFIDITKSSGLSLTPGSYRSCYMQDVDNDGLIDIILMQSSGTMEIWYGRPNLIFTKTTLPFPTQTDLESSLSWTDYDNDGFIDWLVVTPQFTHLYHNDGNNNRWLNITLKGHKANSNGIGTKIITYSEGKPQYKEISFNQCTWGYPPLMAHFGFGAPSCNVGSGVIDSVVVMWQPGGRQVIKNVRYNELVVIDQDSGIVRTIQKPVAISYGYALPYFLTIKSVPPDSVVTMPMAAKIPHSFVQQQIIADEITFSVEYNSDIIDISPAKVAARYTPPAGWSYKSSTMGKDSLVITLSNMGSTLIPDSLDLGSLRFDTYSSTTAKGTYLFLGGLSVLVSGNNYQFCHDYEGDFLGEVLIIDSVTDAVTDNVAASQSLTILPNPSAGNNITVRYFAGQETVAPAEISLFDVLGKEVYHYHGEGSAEKTGVQNFSIPTSELSGGTYLVRLAENGKLTTGKFTVVK